MLWVGNHRPAPPDGSRVGEILREWRKSRGITQTELANRLNWTQPYLSQLESGRAELMRLDQLWHVQRTLDIAPEELGLVAARHAEAPDDVELPHSSIRAGTADGRSIEHSQRQWRTVRRYLDSKRGQLTRSAATLYPGAVRVGSSALISTESWMPAEPMAFSDVVLSWIMDANEPKVRGGEPESLATRPLDFRGGSYERYSRAMRDLSPPRLFENRPGYRLLHADWSASAQLSFTYTAYFESVIDVSTALAHEYAAASMAAGGLPEPSVDALPFRSLVGDPFDLNRRAVLPSIDTLTLRKAKDGSASFLLHYRDPASVAAASSLYHLMPAGTFQPSSIAPSHQANDFSMWRSSMREYAEEFLNLEEADGSTVTPIDYDGVEPFRSMSAARAAGQFEMWCFGVGLDPLTLVGEILTVAVIDADAFDSLFAELVTTNQEGSVVTANPHAPGEGIPFTEEHLEKLLDAQSLAAPAAACLELAWRHRERLLG